MAELEGEEDNAELTLPVDIKRNHIQGKPDSLWSNMVTMSVHIAAKPI
jgi:hypothetical protein